MSLKLKKIDVFIAVFLLIISLFSLTYLATSSPTSQAKVYIYVDHKLIKGAPFLLSEDKLITLAAKPDELDPSREYYPVLLADISISILNNKVAVTYEESPRNYCSNIGYIGLVNFPIVCLPNKTLVIIKNGSNSYVV